MIEIIDNVYDKQDEIEKLLLSDNFAWYVSHESVAPEDIIDLPDIRETWFFTHVLRYNDTINSKHYDSLKELPDYLNLNYKDIIRLRANLNVPQPTNNENNMLPPHKDWQTTDCTSVLYYVNDSDGDTLFFNDDLSLIKRVAPKKGRFVVFNANTYHCGMLPIKNDKRMVINYILN